MSGKAMATAVPLTVLWISGLLGCGTTVSQVTYWEDDPFQSSFDPHAVVYGGTRISAPFFWEIITDPSGPTGRNIGLGVCSLIDIPLCLIADTFLLPLTLSEAWWIHAHEAADSDTASERASEP